MADHQNSMIKLEYDWISLSIFLKVFGYSLIKYTGSPRIARFWGERKRRVMRNRVMRDRF